MNKFQDFMEQLKQIIENHADCPRLPEDHDEFCDFYDDVVHLVKGVHIE